MSICTLDREYDIYDYEKKKRWRFLYLHFAVLHYVSTPKETNLM